jgi:hypothetical protein
MAPARTIPPRIRWSDGSEGLEQPEGLADRLRLTLAPRFWIFTALDYHQRRQEHPEMEVQWTRWFAAD